MNLYHKVEVEGYEIEVVGALKPSLPTSDIQRRGFATQEYQLQLWKVEIFLMRESCLPLWIGYHGGEQRFLVTLVREPVHWETICLEGVEGSEVVLIVKPLLLFLIQIHEELHPFVSSVTIGHNGRTALCYPVAYLIFEYFRPGLYHTQAAVDVLLGCFGNSRTLWSNLLLSITMDASHLLKVIGIEDSGNEIGIDAKSIDIVLHQFHEKRFLTLVEIHARDTVNVV